MKGNVFNDAKCDLSTTGPARSGNGMGYICEFDPSRGKNIPRNINQAKDFKPTRSLTNEFEFNSSLKMS